MIGIILSTFIVVAAGGLLSGASAHVDRRAAAFTAIAALFFHVLVRFAVADHFTEAVQNNANWSGPIAALGIIETAGLWGPALFARWAALPVRIATALYIAGVGMSAAIVYYMPQDLPVVLQSGRRMPGTPMYGSSLLFGVPFFLIGVAGGKLVRRIRDGEKARRAEAETPSESE